MSIILNDPGCTLGNAGNTATPSCAFNPGLITGAMLIPKDKVITLTTTAQFITDIQALCTAGSSLRAYPIYGFVGMEDKTADLAMIEKGYGGKQLGPMPRRDFIFELTAGGLCHQLQLMKFNNDHSHSVLLFDENNTVIGCKTATAAQITGLSLEYFIAHPVKWATGKDAPAKYQVEMGFSKPRELNEDIAFFSLGSSPEDSFQGLNDVELYDLGVTGTTKHHYVGVRTVCDKISLYGAYSTALVYSLFTATLAGAADNPTAITPVASLDGGKGGWDLTFPTTGVHIVTLATPAALAAAHVGEQPTSGFEATGTLSITVV